MSWNVTVRNPLEPPNRKLLGWPGLGQLAYAYGVLGPPLLVWFVLIYGGADYLTGLHDFRVRLHLEGELGMPFVPAMVVFYNSMHLAYLIAPFILRTRPEMHAMAVTWVLITLCAGVVFLLLPSEDAFAAPPDSALGPWRGMFRLADQANLPAYIVFSDRALVEMATYFPQNERQLLAINGVGTAKLEHYGEPFLALLQSYCVEHDLQPLAKGAEALSTQRPTTLGKKRFEEVGERFVGGENIESIHASYDVKTATIIQHLAKYQQAGHVLEGPRVLAASRLSPDAREPVYAAFRELGTERLSPIYEALHGSVSYEELHLLRVAYISLNPPAD